MTGREQQMAVEDLESDLDAVTAERDELQQRLDEVTSARDELAGIAHELHAHKCPSYDTGETCPFRDRLERIAELRKVGAR